MKENIITAAALAVEAQTAVPAAVLLAVAKVETGAVASAVVQGRREPLIRFEGHCFDRLLGDADRARARLAGLAARAAGAVRNPASQAGRWRLLARACAIDAEAAYAATSWGLGQVMGLHWKRLGFASAGTLVAEARRSVEGQFIIAARFLRLGRLDRMLVEGRFEAFARSYNGPAFRRNRYEVKIAAAFRAAEKSLAAHALIS